MVELALLTYVYVEDMASRREPYRDGHLALIASYADAGRLYMAGATGERPSGGSLVFADIAAAEQFVAADPYGAAGLVSSHAIEPYKVVAAKPVPGV